MDYCVYYDQHNERIIDFFPQAIDLDVKNNINKFWNQAIPRKILIELSTQPMNMQELRKRIGHSNSTLHENIKKLEEAGLIESEIIYEGNKIRLLKPKILFVSQSPKYQTIFKKFFQGLWIDRKQNLKIIDFLDKHHDKYFTAEEISAKLNIPIDEVRLSLDSWNSPVTKAYSDLFKDRPFEKKVMYRSRKRK